MRRAWSAALAITLLAGCAQGGAGRAERGASPPLVTANAGGVLGAVREPGARAVLVNVWATWCQPCREEFPDLMRVARENRARGLRLMLVSADFDDAHGQVRAFLAREGVDFPSYLKAGDDMKFIEALDPT